MSPEPRTPSTGPDRAARITARAATLARLALAWLAPSAVAAALAALVAGLVEGVLSTHDPMQIAATAGFAAILGVPAFLAAAAIVRGVWAAWRPERLALVLVDERGAAPRLTAWVIYLGVAMLFLWWATFDGLRWLALVSSFKPVVVSLAEPLMVLAAAAGAAALSRPLVDAITAGLARWERARAVKDKPALTTPRKTLAATVAVAALIAVGAWVISIHPHIGHLDLLFLVYPSVGVAASAAIHAAWRRRAAWRRPAAIAAAASAVLLLAAAALVRFTAPALALDVWSRPTIAGLALDELFDLDDIRADLSDTTFRPKARTQTHPDVILITIDTVRADRTPAGGGAARMPALSALTDRGAVFDWAFSPGNVTRRSIPSIVLGLSPTRVHGRVAGWALRLDPRHVTLAERFRAAGYDTAAFVCCDSFWLPKHKLGINRGLDTLHIDPKGAELSTFARTWILDRDATHPQKPLFVWIHFIEVHNWNGDNPDTKIDDAKRHQYDAVLTQVDHFLGEVTSSFEHRTADHQPIIVVTADHGEGLGDHGAPYHSTDLYDSQTHVPLVITGPGIPAHHVGEPVGLADLAPTLLDLAGFVPPGMPEMDGTPITGLVTGARAPNPDAGYAFMAQIADRSVAQGERAVVSGRWKLIDDGTRLELYDVRADPGELHDLALQNPKQVALMRALLDARAAIDDVSPFP